jgi:hypothetical protein
LPLADAAREQRGYLGRVLPTIGSPWLPQLEGFMENKVRMLRAGEVGSKQWGAEDYNNRSEEGVRLTTGTKTDAFSLEFEERLTSLVDSLKPYMG